LTLLSLQEVLSKTEAQRKTIEEQLDRSGRKGGFHPDEVSLYDGLGKADFADIRETMNTVPLKRIMEFLGKSGTTGIAGAAYLVPDKIYDIMFRSAWMADLTGSAMKIVDTPGSTLKVDYAVSGQFRPKRFGSGGNLPDETLETSQTTITPALWGINTRITNELIEDTQWDVVQMHLEEAAKACAMESSAASIGVLVAASTGDGALNTMNTGASSITDFQDIMDAWAANADDGYISDTIVTHPYAVADFASDASVSAYASGYHDRAVTDPPMMTGSFKGMNIYCLTGEAMRGTAVLYSGSKWRTLVYNKAEAALCVRKRWLKIENYSDPVKDLVGSVVTFREGYNTINKDAINLVSEL
jgi:hypothetical protein